ncbi:m7gpppn-mRNA hydrolase [Anaeramoeba flamelloides]|uniref:M7gpppn-mRNA hydrolase n=1 Tax=Anaeramoeba flamelloides TaxID=1746091 RepID=A0ABQ8XCK4_9EUKA|nr:m7gpppn-mRNA hydrolase [Anaeramoeba flamelloides]
MTRELQAKVLKDLLSRFVINMNYKEENWEIDLIENMRKALWFYTDFYQKQYANLPNLQHKRICHELFKMYKPLKQQNVEVLFQKYKKFRKNQPKCGSAIFSPDLEKVLLVLGVDNGKKIKGKWGFPKGTLEICDKGPRDCVIRETREEIGYDLTGKIYEKDLLITKVGNLTGYLYLITNVDPNLQFHTETRNEIQNIKWFPIGNLPTKQTNFFFSRFQKEMLDWIRFKKSERSNGGGFKINLSLNMGGSNETKN